MKQEKVRDQPATWIYKVILCFLPALKVMIESSSGNIYLWVDYRDQTGGWSPQTAVSKGISSKSCITP